MDTLDKKCKGKFERLLVYFTGFTANDFIGISEEDIIESVECKDKLIARIFFRKYLSEYFNAPDDPFKDLKWMTSPHISKDEPICITSEGLLDLRRRVVGNAFTKTMPIPFFALIKESPEPLILADVKTKLEPDQNERVKTIDLSNTNLVDYDIHTIVDLVMACPNCSVVNLSFNRFRGGDFEFDQALKKLLHMEQIQFVDVTNNEFASSVKSDFFKFLDSGRLSRLIFVPPTWLDNGGWKTVIGGSYQLIVKSAHEKYYNS